MDAHVENLLANKVIGWVYHPDKLMEVLVEKDTGCEVQSSDTDYRPRQRAINYPREIKIDSDSYRVEGFVFEGFVQHMYQDHKGNVTVGLGHLLKDADAAKKLPFYKRPLGPEGKLADATALEREREFNEVRKSERKGKSLTYFLNLTNLRLDPAYIEVLFKADVRESIAELQDHIPELDTYPKMAQLGMLDLAYTLGASRFHRVFEDFEAALDYRNWKKVAAESRRTEKDKRGKTDENMQFRNKVVREWFLEAIKDEPFFVNPKCPKKNI